MVILEPIKVTGTIVVDAGAKGQIMANSDLFQNKQSARCSRDV